MAKPTLCLDFDGVIHSYKSGWKGAGVIPDPPVQGAMEFIVAAVEHFQVDIFSSRSADPIGRRAMWSYVKQHLEEAVGEIDASRIISLIDFPFDKPAAFVSIDDRAITFEGKWPDIEALKTFKPWNKRPDAKAGASKRTVADILCMANASGEIGYVDCNSRKADDDHCLIQEALTRGLIRFLRYDQVPAKKKFEPEATVGEIDTLYRRASVYELTKRGAAFLASELRKARA